MIYAIVAIWVLWFLISVDLFDRVKNITYEIRGIKTVNHRNVNTLEDHKEFTNRFYYFYVISNILETNKILHDKEFNINADWSVDISITINDEEIELSRAWVEKLVKKYWEDNLLT